MRIKLLLSLALFAMNVSAQVVKDYNPAIQRTTNLQYFKPVEKRLFTGDCMPYYHEGTFYIYWLLDEGHHASWSLYILFQAILLPWIRFRSIKGPEL